MHVVELQRFGRERSAARDVVVRPPRRREHRRATLRVVERLLRFRQRVVLQQRTPARRLARGGSARRRAPYTERAPHRTRGRDAERGVDPGLVQQKRPRRRRRRRIRRGRLGTRPLGSRLIRLGRLLPGEGVFLPPVVAHDVFGGLKHREHVFHGDLQAELRRRDPEVLGARPSIAGAARRERAAQDVHRFLVLAPTRTRGRTERRRDLSCRLRARLAPARAGYVRRRHRDTSPARPSTVLCPSVGTHYESSERYNGRQSSTSELPSVSFRQPRGVRKANNDATRSFQGLTSGRATLPRDGRGDACGGPLSRSPSARSRLSRSPPSPPCASPTTRSAISTRGSFRTIWTRWETREARCTPVAPPSSTKAPDGGWTDTSTSSARTPTDPGRPRPVTATRSHQLRNRVPTMSSF